MKPLRIYLLPVAAMTTIVLAANIAVQFPLFAQLGSLQLADILTWGAFVYPFAFLVTDLTNRRYGPQVARRAVYVGFAMAVLCSIVVPPLLFDLGLLGYATAAERLFRIAIASGTAFLAAQLLDIAVFNRLRGRAGGGRRRPRRSRGRCSIRSCFSPWPSRRCSCSWGRTSPSRWKMLRFSAFLPPKLRAGCLGGSAIWE